MGAMLISWSGILASISSMATIASASGETASNRRHDAARSSMDGRPGHVADLLVPLDRRTVPGRGRIVGEVGDPPQVALVLDRVVAVVDAILASRNCRVLLGAVRRRVAAVAALALPSGCVPERSGRRSERSPDPQVGQASARKTRQQQCGHDDRGRGGRADQDAGHCSGSIVVRDIFHVPSMSWSWAFGPHRCDLRCARRLSRRVEALRRVDEAVVGGCGVTADRDGVLVEVDGGLGRVRLLGDRASCPAARPTRRRCSTARAAATRDRVRPTGPPRPDSRRRGRPRRPPRAASVVVVESASPPASVVVVSRSSTADASPPSSSSPPQAARDPRASSPPAAVRERAGGSSHSAVLLLSDTQHPTPQRPPGHVESVTTLHRARLPPECARQDHRAFARSLRGLPPTGQCHQPSGRSRTLASNPTSRRSVSVLSRSGAPGTARRS